MASEETKAILKHEHTAAHTRLRGLNLSDLENVIKILRLESKVSREEQFI